MIVDCHTHISQTAEPRQLKAAGEADTVTSSVVLAAPGGEKSSKVNKELSAYMQKRSGDWGFALVDPLTDKAGPKELAELRDDLGLAGLVMYCPNGRFHPTHTKAMNVYEAAVEVGMPIFFHNCGPYSKDAVLDFAQPYLLDEVARTFPDLRIVIGGMGEPFVNQTICMLGKHRHVYADLTISAKRAWGAYNTVVAAYECDVMEKLFFGSGYPAAQPGECIELLLGFNKLLGDTKLPSVPRGSIRGVISRDVPSILGLR